MPRTLPYSPQEARERLAVQQRQQDTTRRASVEMEGLVSAVEAARADLEKSLQAFVHTCDVLRQASRKVSADAPAIVQYRNYANLQLRLAGAIGQALKRSESGAKILQNSRREQEELERRDEQARIQQEIRKAHHRVEESLLPAHDDFESLYGDDYQVEDLINAS